MDPHGLDGWMQHELDELESNTRLRTLTDAELRPNGRILMDGRDMLNLCSNDYLGCANRFSVSGIGFGAGASRLVSGNHVELRELERELAELHGTEECLVFGSGYLANFGVVSCVMGKGDVIFSDKLNHASIVDGATLSRADHVRYRHGDMGHLEYLLRRHAGSRRKLIVTDAVFSMDGDCAPLTTLVELKHAHCATLMVDEAHSGGVMGPRGAGLSAELGVAAQVDVHMGTLGKAFGCYGAYVCGSRTLKNFLINRARSVIFSTALPPAMAAAARKSVEWIRSADTERALLKRKATTFREELLRSGLDCGTSVTQIVPVIIGPDAHALIISEMLRDDGIAAVAIRPPTVPQNKARIRFSVSAVHEDDQLLNAVNAIVRRVHEVNQERG